MEGGMSTFLSWFMAKGAELCGKTGGTTGEQNIPGSSSVALGISAMSLPAAGALLEQFKGAVSSFPGGPVPKPLADLLVKLKVGACAQWGSWIQDSLFVSRAAGHHGVPLPAPRQHRVTHRAAGSLDRTCVGTLAGGNSMIVTLAVVCVRAAAGEALEYATILSTLASDSEAFERHVAQVKAYYADFK